jgi:hypothetical protein
VVRRLAPRPEEPPRALAKRLRKELKAKGVDIKHENALHAASRLLGFENWYAAKAWSAMLKLTTVGPSGREELVETWHALSAKLCDACDEFKAERPARAFHVRFGAGYMMLSAQIIAEEDAAQPQSWPVLVVNPLGNEAHWLEDAPPALERLRRYLEETGEAVLDGVAVLQLCHAYNGRLNFMARVHRMPPTLATPS